MFLVGDYQRLRLFEGIFSEPCLCRTSLNVLSMLTPHICEDDLFFNNLTNIDPNQCCFLFK